MRDVVKVKRPGTSKSDSVKEGSINSDNSRSVSKKSRVIKSSVFPWLVTLVLLVFGVAGTLYYKNQADKVQADPSSVQQEKNQAETERVIEALKKIFLIGETEAPTVARIEDPEKLKTSNATFYKDVQQGDYLVIYPKRAIIFRESANQVINTAPIINSNDLQSGEGTAPAATEPLPSVQPGTESR